MPAANREVERLSDRRLIGHLLADRLLRPGAAATVPAMQAWLQEFADLPDAPLIHERLARRLPRGVTPPAAPIPRDTAGVEAGILDDEEASRAAGPLVRRPALDRVVRARVSEGQPGHAQQAVAAARGISTAYAALLHTEIAQGAFRQGRDAEALRVAQDALQHDANSAAAAQQAGLAAWTLGQYDSAFRFFERAARSAQAGPVLRASAAYWAARAAVRSRRPNQYAAWMLLAAQEPRTFHGMIARRTLGLPPGLIWERDIADGAHAASLAETAGGWRALALLQIGQTARAEAELRLLHSRARNNPRVVHSILATAEQAGLSGLAAMVSENLPRPSARDTSRFPLPALAPPGGFSLDPALLYALALQESRFNPDAISPAGARGLLQIMPATASYVANDPSLRGAGARRLHDPAFSLEIGQRYLHYLARHGVVRGDLVRMLAAYNAGPGNLSRWLATIGHRDDPMLFIESIPVGETRAFVQRVLTYSWIYANRLDLPSPSLDALTRGEFPRFAEPEDVVAMLRERPLRAN
jgi:soluble lytic murein transglycosylase-like protein